jgi:hypothetical protein
MPDTFTITKEVSYLDLWEMVWGADGAGTTYWADMVRKPNGDDIDLWKTDSEGNLVGNPQPFIIHDTEEDKWHTITLASLALAFRHADRENLTHCGNCAIVDFEEQDACNGDVLIQLAIFGEVVYG